MIHNVLLDVYVDLNQLNVKEFLQFHQYQIHMNERRKQLDKKEHDNDDQYVIHFHQFQYQI
jgi:hypothetical protein